MVASSTADILIQNWIHEIIRGVNDNAYNFVGCKSMLGEFSFGLLFDVCINTWNGQSPNKKESILFHTCIPILSKNSQEDQLSSLTLSDITRNRWK